MFSVKKYFIARKEAKLAYDRYSSKTPNLTLRDYRLIANAALTTGAVRLKFFDDWFTQDVIPYIGQREEIHPKLEFLRSPDILVEIRKSKKNVWQFVPFHMQDTSAARKFADMGILPNGFDVEAYLNARPQTGNIHIDWSQKQIDLSGLVGCKREPGVRAS